MSSYKLKIENLCFEYVKNEPILQGINIRANEQENIGIIGANGAGKSTLLKLIVGLNLNFTGQIKVDDVCVEKKTLSQIRQRIGYVFQEPANQLFMTNVHSEIAFAPQNYGMSKEQTNRLVNEAMRKVHIEHLKDRSVYKLSDGEKKLVSIAAVLSIRPSIILMDEPSSTLDPRNRRNLIGLLNEFDGLKIITSHDLDFIWDTCQRTILINNGRIVADGNPQDILRNKKMLEENGLELPLSLIRR